jgi:hypothetical protein
MFMALPDTSFLVGPMIGSSAGVFQTDAAWAAWAVGIVIRCDILVLHPYLGGTWRR